MSVKLTQVRAPYSLIGHSVPVNPTYSGEIGNLVQVLYEANKFCTINHGPGKDVNEEWLYDGGFEIKSRFEYATAPYTIATMSEFSILHTAYEDSLVRDKMGVHLHVGVSDRTCTVINEKFYDFTKPEIQELIKYDYETGRNHLRRWHGSTSPTHSKAGGYFEEVKKKSGMFKFRVTTDGMNMLIGMATSNMHNLFE
jgi:hypothetical protein